MCFFQHRQKMDLFKTLPKDGVEARAAFQKTASDMEHERINLMSVITQVTRRMLWEHDMNRMMWLTHTHNQMMTQKSSSSVKLLSKRLEDLDWHPWNWNSLDDVNFWGAGEPELRAFVPWDGSTVRSCNQNSTGSGIWEGKGGGQVLKWSCKLTTPYKWPYKWVSLETSWFGTFRDVPCFEVCLLHLRLWDSSD